MTNVLITNFDYFQTAFRNSDGYAVGTETNPDNAADGTNTHAYLYREPVTFTPVGINYRTVEGFGGGRVWQRQTVGVGGFDNGSLQISGYDDVLSGYFRDITVDTTTNTNHRITARNANNGDMARFISIFTLRTTDENGATKYLNRVLLNTQFNENATEAGQGDGQNPSPTNFEVVPAFSNRDAFGQLWSAGNVSVVDDKDMMVDILSDYPLGLTTYIDDGTATTGAFNLGYRPASETVGRHFFFRNGADESSNIAGITEATGAVDLTAAGSAGDIVIALYETEFVATS